MNTGEGTAAAYVYVPLRLRDAASGAARRWPQNRPADSSRGGFPSTAPVPSAGRRELLLLPLPVLLLLLLLLLERPRSSAKLEPSDSTFAPPRDAGTLVSPPSSLPPRRKPSAEPPVVGPLPKAPAMGDASPLNARPPRPPTGAAEAAVESFPPEAGAVDARPDVGTRPGLNVPPLRAHFGMKNPRPPARPEAALESPWLAPPEPRSTGAEVGSADGLDPHAFEVPLEVLSPDIVTKPQKVASAQKETTAVSCLSTREASTAARKR